jgi:hypothetical protein
VTTEERAIRIACVSKALAAFGEVSDETAAAIVDLTSGIPFYVPPAPGEKPTRDLLFPRAVVEAALNVTHGKVKPGDIMAAAISIAGTTRTDQGHSAERRWVKIARAPLQALPMPLDHMQAIPAGAPIRAIRGGE